MQQQKKIILFLIIILTVSSIWLFRASDKAIDPDAGKNWWAVYFVEPKSDKLDFVIENHSSRADFHWEVLENNQKIKEGNEKIERGQKSQIISEISADFGKIIIRVNLDEEKKEIYKNF